MGQCLHDKKTLTSSDRLQEINNVFITFVLCTEWFVRVTQRPAHTSRIPPFVNITHNVVTSSFSMNIGCAECSLTSTSIQYEVPRLIHTAQLGQLGG